MSEEKKDGRFKKGTSGNPAGSSKARRESQASAQERVRDPSGRGAAYPRLRSADCHCGAEQFVGRGDGPDKAADRSGCRQGCVVVRFPAPATTDEDEQNAAS